MKAYKKRAKAGWCGGKGYKEQSNRSERTYAKEEIRQAEKEMLEGDDFRYNSTKRNRNCEASLQYRINDLNIKAEKAREDNGTSWLGYSFYNDWAKKLKEKLDKIRNNNEN